MGMFYLGVAIYPKGPWDVLVRVAMDEDTLGIPVSVRFAIQYDDCSDRERELLISCASRATLLCGNELGACRQTNTVDCYSEWKIVSSHFL